LAKKIEAVPLMAAPAMLTPATSGYSYPKCIRCPQAEYDQRAVDQRVQGTVTLVATIGTDGKAHDIVVMKPLPDGLTQKAIEAVGRWTFKPAMKPNGEPVDVRQTIEVTFHLYNN
jgi:protein TonB